MKTKLTGLQLIEKHERENTKRENDPDTLVIHNILSDKYAFNGTYYSKLHDELFDTTGTFGGITKGVLDNASRKAFTITESGLISTSYHISAIPAANMIKLAEYFKNGGKNYYRAAVCYALLIKFSPDKTQLASYCTSLAELYEKGDHFLPKDAVIGQKVRNMTPKIATKPVSSKSSNSVSLINSSPHSSSKSSVNPPVSVKILPELSSKELQEAVRKINDLFTDPMNIQFELCMKDPTFSDTSCHAILNLKVEDCLIRDNLANTYNRLFKQYKETFDQFESACKQLGSNNELEVALLQEHFKPVRDKFSAIFFALGMSITNLRKLYAFLPEQSAIAVQQEIDENPSILKPHFHETHETFKGIMKEKERWIIRMGKWDKTIEKRYLDASATDRKNIYKTIRGAEEVIIKLMINITQYKASLCFEAWEKLGNNELLPWKAGKNSRDRTNALEVTIESEIIALLSRQLDPFHCLSKWENEHIYVKTINNSLGIIKTNNSSTSTSYDKNYKSNIGSKHRVIDNGDENKTCTYQYEKGLIRKAKHKLVLKKKKNQKDPDQWVEPSPNFEIIPNSKNKELTLNALHKSCLKKFRALDKTFLRAFELLQVKLESNIGNYETKVKDRWVAKSTSTHTNSIKAVRARCTPMKSGEVASDKLTALILILVEERNNIHKTHLYPDEIYRTSQNGLVADTIWSKEFWAALKSFFGKSELELAYQDALDLIINDQLTNGWYLPGIDFKQIVLEDKAREEAYNKRKDELVLTMQGTIKDQLKQLLEDYTKSDSSTYWLLFRHHKEEAKALLLFLSNNPEASHNELLRELNRVFIAMTPNKTQKPTGLFADILDLSVEKVKQDKLQNPQQLEEDEELESESKEIISEKKEYVNLSFGNLDDNDEKREIDLNI